METKGELAKAVIAVMKAVKGIDKNMTVGSGSSAYQGVSDEDVKDAIGLAMQENGLCILPIGVEATTEVSRWEERNGSYAKQKQSVFTTATTRYLLLHESGESQEIAGYGQGVDSQDKGAGKSTTYALKYTLINTFLVATRKIDDADKTNSEEHPVPQPADNRPWLTEKMFTQALKKIKDGDRSVLEKTTKAFQIKPEWETQLKTA